MRPRQQTDQHIQCSSTGIIELMRPEIDPNASECHKIGTSGECGVRCPLFRRGACWNVIHDKQFDSFLPGLMYLATSVELELICELYPEAEPFRKLLEERFG